MKTIVAENAKRILLAKNLKQGAVAVSAGYSEKQFSAMITGRKRIIDTDVLRIAKALGVSPNELFALPPQQ